MGWRWTAHRLAVSAFLVFHLSATCLWVLPGCPIKQRFFATATYYMLPLGLWQYWGMFAPDPVRESYTLEAEVFDAKGLRHAFSFPRLANFSKWRGIPRFRHSKFGANLFLDEFAKQREFAARHVMRQLKLPAEAYPVNVHLFFELRPTPEPGGPPPDPLAPTRPLPLGSFTFSKIDEVRP